MLSGSFVPSFLRSFVPSVALAATLAGSAAAGVCGLYSPNNMCCRRDYTAGSTDGGFEFVDVYVNYASFGAYGSKTYTCNGRVTTQSFTVEQIRAQVEWALNLWNRAGAKVRFQYAGEAAANVETGCQLAGLPGPPCNTNKVVIKMLGVLQMDGSLKSCLSGWGLAEVFLCQDRVDFDGSFEWSVAWGPGYNIGLILVHELGHTLGRLDENCLLAGVSPPTPCPNYDFASVLVQQPQGNLSNGVVEPGVYLNLWHRDIYALRHDPFYGYGEKSDTRARTYYSTNGFASYYTLTDPLLKSNARPANAFGESAYHVAAAKAASNTYGDNDIYVMRGDGVTWSAWSYIGSWTQSDLSMAYGGGLFVLLHAAADNSRSIYYQTNQGTGTWTNPVIAGDGSWPAEASIGPPGISYNATRNRFILAWARRATVPKLCSASAAVCYTTFPSPRHYLCNWTQPVCLDGSQGDDVLRPLGTPGLINPTTSSLTYVSYPALSGTVPVIRTAYINNDPDGTQSWDQNQPFATVPVGGTSLVAAASAPSGTYRHMLAYLDSQPLSTVRLRWDPNPDFFTTPTYPNLSAQYFSPVASPGHLAYGTPWSEFALFLSGY